MKDTMKLIGPSGAGANVDAGSEAEKLWRGRGWKTADEWTAEAEAGKTKGEKAESRKG